MASSMTFWIDQMAPENKQLYVELGQRIAQARKSMDLTQTQVAEQIGLTQQTIAHYEVGRLRISVATLIRLSDILGYSLDELVYGEEIDKRKCKKRGPASKLEKLIDKIEELPRTKQQVVADMLEGLIRT